MVNISKQVIWQHFQNELRHTLKQMKMVFLQEDNGKLRLLAVYSILNEEMFQYWQIKEELLEKIRVNAEAEQPFVEAPEKPSLTQLISEKAKRQLMDLGPLSSSI